MMPRIDTGPVTLSPAGGGAMAPGGDARQAALQGALAGLVGQSLPAEVLSNFTDGSSLVKIAGLNVRLMLPPGVAVGSEVPLTVIAASPRPTFQFGSGGAGDLATLLYSESGAAPGNSATAAASYGALASQDAPLPGAPRPPSGAAPDATAAIPNAAAGAAASPAADTPAQAASAAGAATGPANPAAANATATATTPPAAAAPATAYPPADTPASPADSPATNAATTPAAYPATNSAASPAGNPAGNPATGQAATPALNPPANVAAYPGAATAPPPAAINTLLAAIAAGIEAGADGAPAATAGAATTLAATAAAPGAAAAAAGAAAPATAASDAQKPGSLAATLLGRAPLTPSNQLPDLNAGTPGAALSSTARALTIMLSAAQSLPGTPMVLTGKIPLLADGPPDAGQLAKVLQETVSQSGLFYESHVSDWIKGELSLPDLTREPQMQRMLEAATAAPRPADAGPDLGAAQMVNLQLHTQEQARVQWNGQAWPGQHMQWDIRREQGQGGRGSGAEQGEPEQIWRSGVRFRFQMLGEVSAAVTIVGDQVHIQVLTDSDGAAATLRSYAGELESAMAAAGAPLSSLAIAADT